MVLHKTSRRVRGAGCGCGRRRTAAGGLWLVGNAAEEDIHDRERRLIHTVVHGRARPFFLIEDGRAGLGCTRTYVVESGSGPFI
jgi:hypothetical protein